MVNKKKDPSISLAFSLQAEPQGSQIINEGVSPIGMVGLEYGCFAIPNQLMDLGNNHQWVLTLQKGDSQL